MLSGFADWSSATGASSIFFSQMGVPDDLSLSPLAHLVDWKYDEVGVRMLICSRISDPCTLSLFHMHAHAVSYTYAWPLSFFFCGGSATHLVK
jgi:hypothetical protein